MPVYNEGVHTGQQNLATYIASTSAQTKTATLEIRFQSVTSKLQVKSNCRDSLSKVKKKSLPVQTGFHERRKWCMAVYRWWQIRSMDFLRKGLTITWVCVCGCVRRCRSQQARGNESAMTGLRNSLMRINLFPYISPVTFHYRSPDKQKESSGDP